MTVSKRLRRPLAKPGGPPGPSVGYGAAGKHREGSASWPSEVGDWASHLPPFFLSCPHLSTPFSHFNFQNPSTLTTKELGIITSLWETRNFSQKGKHLKTYGVRTEAANTSLWNWFLTQRHEGQLRTWRLRRKCQERQDPRSVNIVQPAVSGEERAFFILRACFSGILDTTPSCVDGLVKSWGSWAPKSCPLQ